MKRLKGGLLAGLVFTILGTLLVYIQVSAYVGFLWHLEASPSYGFLVIRLIAIVFFAVKALVTLPFQMTGLALLVVVNSVLLFFPVGFFYVVTRSKRYEGRHPESEGWGWPTTLLLLWLLVCAGGYFVEAVSGTYFGSVLEYWTSTPSRLVFFLLGPVLWALYNFNLRPGSFMRSKASRKWAQWLDAKEDWNARAAAARTREQVFELLDELYEYYYVPGEFPLTLAIMQGFGVSVEAKDAMLADWAADRQHPEWPPVVSANQPQPQHHD